MHEPPEDTVRCASNFQGNIFLLAQFLEMSTAHPLLHLSIGTRIKNIKNVTKCRDGRSAKSIARNKVGMIS